MNPLVTVAIASYNNAPYIERCVDSVIRQTYYHLEILIVDDGSTDDTLSRLDKYKTDERVTIIPKENGGLSSVRQKGLETAKGDFISFIDADDYLNPDYIKEMLGVIAEHKADVCLCGVRFEDASGNRMDKESTQFSYQKSDKGFRLSHQQFADTSVSYRRRFALSDSWNKLYRVSFLKEAGLEFILPKGFNGSDSVFNQKVALHEPVYVSTDYEGYVHVIYNRSAAHRRNKRLQEGFLIQAEQLIQDCEKQGIVEMMTDRLAEMFYSYELRAFEDVYQENGISVKSELKAMRSKHKDFLKRFPYLMRGKIHGKSLVLFKQVLDIFPCLLGVYFNYRRRTI